MNLGQHIEQTRLVVGARQKPFSYPRRFLGWKHGYDSVHPEDNLVIKIILPVAIPHLNMITLGKVRLQVSKIFITGTNGQTKIFISGKEQ